jgi:hypothetical protein
MSVYQGMSESNVNNLQRKPTFVSQTSEYSSVAEDHKGELDLFEDISQERYETGLYHDVIRIRRSNEDTFPYHAPTFITWYDMKQTDPLTREYLGFLQKRIDAKKKARELFGNVKVVDVTPEFLVQCVEEGVAAKIISTERKDQITDEELLCVNRLEAFGSVNAFLKAKYISNATFVTSVSNLEDQPIGSWLLRCSSQHSNIMKNSEIIVLAYKKESKVCQRRFIHVYGVGWFEGNEKLPLNSYKLMSIYLTRTTRLAAPHYTSIWNILATKFDTGDIDLSKLVVVDALTE